MSLLDSPKLQEFILFLERRHLRQLVTMICSVVDAAEGRRVRNGSLAVWLHLLRDFGRRPGRFLKVLELTSAADMDIDSGHGEPAVAAIGREELPIPGAQRKREATCGGDEASDGGSTMVEAASSRLQRVKRRILAWMRPHQWFVGFPFGASRRPTVAPRLR